MPDAPRRVRPALAAAALACLVVAPVAVAVPAQAAPLPIAKKGPTAAQINAAKAKVSGLKGRVADLQDEAEVATEAYDGATVSAQKAVADAASASMQAQVAQAAYLTKVSLAQAAGAAKQDADTTALAASLATLAADQRVADATKTLAQLANSAYRSQGSLAMVSAVLEAKDPQALMQGRHDIGAVGQDREAVVKAVTTAKAAADAVRATALSAQAKATSVAGQALAAQDAATAAYTVARTAAHGAALSLQHERRTLIAAKTAKRHAQALVAQAEDALGSAVTSVAALQRQAAAARAVARSFQVGATSSAAASTAISWAMKEIGVPYSWGGGDADGPTRGFAQGANTVGFDCSGLTLFAYAHAGIGLDHFTGSQWNVGPRISRGDLQPGDLMFFAYDTSDPSTIHHVAMYLGDGKMIEAPHTGSVVKISSAYRSDFIGGTRPWA